MPSSETQKGIFSYVADLAYGATKYPCGWMKPATVRGYFSDSPSGKLQQLFHDALIEHGFSGTYWQLVFPGQTAGIVRKQDTSPSQPNEHHVRFYNDGAIDCELEYDRFHRKHWTGHRESGIEFLQEFLATTMQDISADVKNEIQKLFQKKQFTERCIRNGNLET